jgi:hypothetical protein
VAADPGDLLTTVAGIAVAGAELVFGAGVLVGAGAAFLGCVGCAGALALGCVGCAGALALGCVGCGRAARGAVAAGLVGALVGVGAPANVGLIPDAATSRIARRVTTNARADRPDSPSLASQLSGSPPRYPIPLILFPLTSWSATRAFGSMHSA